jgi:hypothetical protein
MENRKPRSTVCVLFGNAASKIFDDAFTQSAMAQREPFNTKHSTFNIRF